MCEKRNVTGSARCLTPSNSKLKHLYGMQTTPTLIEKVELAVAPGRRQGHWLRKGQANRHVPWRDYGVRNLGRQRS